MSLGNMGLLSSLYFLKLKKDPHEEHCFYHSMWALKIQPFGTSLSWGLFHPRNFQIMFHYINTRCIYLVYQILRDKDGRRKQELSFFTNILEKMQTPP